MHFSGASMKILPFTYMIFLTGYTGKLKPPCSSTLCPFSCYVDHRAGNIAVVCIPAKN